MTSASLIRRGLATTSTASPSAASPALAFALGAALAFTALAGAAAESFLVAGLALAAGLALLLALAGLTFTTAASTPSGAAAVVFSAFLVGTKHLESSARQASRPP